MLNERAGTEIQWEEESKTYYFLLKIQCDNRKASFKHRKINGET